MRFCFIVAKFQAKLSHGHHLCKFPQTVFTLKGSWRRSKISIDVPLARSAKSPSNFCAQAADFVTPTLVSSTRNGRSRHFPWKNIMVLAHFSSTSLLGSPGCPSSQSVSQIPPRWLPGVSQMPPNASRYLPDAPQMPTQ